jgi:hypothetical protein
MQPSWGSSIPASQSSCSFFVFFAIAALYPPGPSLVEFILHIQLFHLVAEGFGFWSGMLLYECPIHLT